MKLQTTLTADAVECEIEYSQIALHSSDPEDNDFRWNIDSISINCFSFSRGIEVAVLIYDQKWNVSNAYFDKLISQAVSEIETFYESRRR
jgi:hypothetical protein